MEPEVLKVTSPWDRLDLPRKAVIEYGTDALFPSDDKMVDVWLALHGDKINKAGTECIYTRPMRTEDEQAIYDLLTINLIERAKKYGSLERP
jgi:hypothetical protein